MIKKRPPIVEECHLEYLEELRDSGETNMMDAGTHLSDEFELTRNEAKTILQYWMEVCDA